MKALLLLATLALAPAPAHAGVDYKCDSVKYSDQVGGWMRFGTGGRDGSINLEYWNGYPPITLVDATFANGKATRDGGTEFVSEPDHLSNDTVATVELPSGYYSEDKFVAKVELRYVSPENRRLRISKYDLSCVRH